MDPDQDILDQLDRQEGPSITALTALIIGASLIAGAVDYFTLRLELNATRELATDGGCVDSDCLRLGPHSRLSQVQLSRRRCLFGRRYRWRGDAPGIFKRSRQPSSCKLREPGGGAFPWRTKPTFDEGVTLPDPVFSYPHGVPMTLAERISEVPELYEEGNESTARLLSKSGYLDAPQASLTVEDVEQALLRHPELADRWLERGHDQRTWLAVGVSEMRSRTVSGAELCRRPLSAGAQKVACGRGIHCPLCRFHRRCSQSSSRPRLSHHPVAHDALGEDTCKSALVAIVARLSVTLPNATPW